MRIVLAGGTGLLGRALHGRLHTAGHQVLVLTRQPQPGQTHQRPWKPDGTAGPWAEALAGADAVVNLVGEGIADARWTVTRKAALRSSRLLATRSLVAAIREVPERPAAFVSASAVGYYGAHGDEVVTETTPPGADFLATLGVEWEREAEDASSLTRLALLRTGLVMDRSGGALGKMLLPFRLGIGGRLGSGTQYMPWIHWADWVSLVVWIIETREARGAFNLTAPTPVNNAEFTRTLARTLNRPALIPVPGFALRLALGELATALLTGQRAIPARAQQMGFTFRFDELEPALRDLLR
jgi:uncharacterized protein (TIGR01777 family)